MGASFFRDKHRCRRTRKVYASPCHPLGAWHLRASATGFVTQAYEEHNDYSSAIVLTAAEPTIDLHFRLSPEAEIAGTVLDEAGEGVRGARVTLQHRGANPPDEEGQTFRNRMVTQTDDRGSV